MNRHVVMETVRQILGRGLSAGETRELELALREDGCGRGPLPRPRRIGPQGIALIKRFEGCARRLADGRVAAYPDPGTGAAPWTIGWGATGAGIGPGTVWTQAQCDARLEADLARYAADVDRALGDAATTQAQFDALVSFHYNTGAIARATLTRRHKAGDSAAAAREFARWNRAGGRVMKGLVRRREAEAELYRGSPGGV
ncbi:lysozyme [Paraurantiacibacter namhicola]|uniref:Lysozyme n=1 Tax=Paraurantiacibacter namhicola TaxID=645517 RepID=A0A1C7DAV1_9SPHN|nr:lysozyme [Paraurantiacibacter namhicola]ANU08574.1 Lysozyme RrrD [Paraurantiacibacter namhicola]